MPFYPIQCRTFFFHRGYVRILSNKSTSSGAAMKLEIEDQMDKVEAGVWAKEKGGMSFRDMEKFNATFLTRQWWRIFDSLIRYLSKCS